MSTKERFIHYLKFKGIGQTAFEMDAGLSRGSISQKSGFTANSLEKIAAVCPDLDFNWLIRGEGDMLRTTEDKRPRKINLDNYPVSNDTRGVAESRYTYGSSTTENEYIAMFRKKDEQIDRLTRVIERLTSKL